MTYNTMSNMTYNTMSEEEEIARLPHKLQVELATLGLSGWCFRKCAYNWFAMHEAEGRGWHAPSLGALITRVLRPDIAETT